MKKRLQTLVLTETETHPYIAEVVLDPITFDRFQRTFEGEAAVQVLSVDRGLPDRWTVHAARASRAVCDAPERNW